MDYKHQIYFGTIMKLYPSTILIASINYLINANNFKNYFAL